MVFSFRFSILITRTCFSMEKEMLVFCGGCIRYRTKQTRFIVRHMCRLSETRRNTKQMDTSVLCEALRFGYATYILIQTYTTRPLLKSFNYMATCYNGHFFPKTHDYNAIVGSHFPLDRTAVRNNITSM